MSEHTDNGNLGSAIDYNPLLLKSIVKDVESAKTHLNNHVTMEEEILTLDKNCEYCQIYLRTICLSTASSFSVFWERISSIASSTSKDQSP